MSASTASMNQEFQYQQHSQTSNQSSSSSSQPVSSATNPSINNDAIIALHHQIQELQAVVTAQQRQLSSIANQSSSLSQSSSNNQNIKPSKPGFFTGSKIGITAFLWLEELKNYFNAAGVIGNQRTVF